jgi:DNA-binding NarL/FixJ family response regulator
MSIRVVIVDDHQMFREGLREALSRNGDIDVVGEADNADAALRVVDASAPDVLLVDLVLRGAGGLDVVRALRTRSRPRILVVSMHAADDFLPEVLRAGAAGFVHKGQPVAELIQAIDRVHRGETHLPRGLREDIALLARRRTDRPDGIRCLSARERDVFQLVIGGRSNKEVAAVLKVSVKTVETHRSNINRKLGVHSTGQLVRYAAVHGVLSADDPGALMPST